MFKHALTRRRGLRERARANGARRLHRIVVERWESRSCIADRLAEHFEDARFITSAMAEDWEQCASSTTSGPRVKAEPSAYANQVAIAALRGEALEMADRLGEGRRPPIAVLRLAELPRATCALAGERVPLRRGSAYEFAARFTERARRELGSRNLARGASYQLPLGARLRARSRQLVRQDVASVQACEHWREGWRPVRSRLVSRSTSRIMVEGDTDRRPTRRSSALSRAGGTLW